MELLKPTVLIIVSLSVVHGGAFKCTGLIAFSSTGAVSVHPTGLVKFRANHVDSGHGWVSETGAFTVQCPGHYHVACTGTGDARTKITIQKRGAISGAKFEPIIATGLGGGTISTIMQLKMGEQIAMVVTGALQTDPANSVPVTSFNAYRIGD